MLNQINLFVLLLGTAQWLVLCLFLIRRKRGLTDVYFLLMLFTVGLQMIFKVASKIWLTEHIRLPYMLSYELPYLVGPLLYLQIKSRVIIEFNKKDLLHMIPFVFWSLVTILNFFWIHTLGVTAYGRAFLELFSLGVYSILAWRCAQTAEPETRKLKSFILNIAVAEALITITLAVMYIFYGRLPDIRLLFAALTYLIYWISYQCMSDPDFFNSRGSLVVAPLQGHRKYDHSGLKPADADHISQRLQRLMAKQKIFLDPDLTIDGLANKVGVSRHHLSQAINVHFEKSYLDFVNDYRLSEAMARLRDSKYSHFTIAAIALDSGFNSISSFNDLFKKRFGGPPSRFRNLDLNKMTA